MNDIAARSVSSVDRFTPNRAPRPTLDLRRQLPTAPCSVVWSKGRAFVLEQTAGRSRWVGLDGYGRPRSFSAEALDRRGWSHRRA